MTSQRALSLLSEHDPWLLFPLEEAEERSARSSQANFGPEPLLFLTDLTLVRDAYLWLQDDPKRHLVVTVENRRDWGSFLQQEWAEECLVHPRLHFCHPKSKLASLAWRYLFIPYQIVPDQESVSACVDAIHLAASTMRHFKLESVQNLFENLQSEGDWIDGRSLENRYVGIPALICGAGPSLEEAQIQEFSQAGGLVIACGSAIGLLAERDIPFDFGAALDPLSPPERFPDRLECPLFFQPTLNAQVFQRFKGPKIYMGSSAQFPLEIDLLDKSQVPPFFFDAGWTAATFGVAIAAFLGCGPISTVGVDHAYAPDRPYAYGLKKVEGQNLAEKKRGDGLFTQKDFRLADRFIQNVKSTAHSRTAEGDKPLLPVPQIRKGSCDLISQIREAAEAFKEKEPLLIEACLMSTPLYHTLLRPLWEVWHHVFAREEGDQRLHELLFYQKVIQSYADQFSL